MPFDIFAGGVVRGARGDGLRRRVGGVGGPVAVWLTSRRGCRWCVGVAAFAVVYWVSHAVR